MWRCSGNNIYMLKINFYPESNLKDFTEAVKVFQQIWVEDGEKITQKWEEVTGLKFIETEINAVVADLKSCSHPLTLRYSNELDIKKSTLVHELGHRILYKRGSSAGDKTSFERHKFLFLALYDVFLELYGQEFTSKIIAWDSQLGKDKGQSMYEDAWQWALKYKTKEERQKVFKEILSGQYAFLMGSENV